jgi:hypothetical protein
MAFILPMLDNHQLQPDWDFESMVSKLSKVEYTESGKESRIASLLSTRGNPEHRSRPVSMIAALRRARSRGTLTLLPWFAAMIAIASLVWWLGSGEQRDSIDIETAETAETGAFEESGIDSEVEELRYVTSDLQDGLKHLNMRVHNLSATIDRLEQQFEEDLISLNRQVYRLSNSVARVGELEEEILHVRADVDSITVAAPVETDTGGPAGRQSAAQPSAAATRMKEPMEIREPESTRAVSKQEDAGVAQEAVPEKATSIASVEIDRETAVTARPRPLVTSEPAADTRRRTPGQGPWVINLASIQDKDAADRFAARAKSKGITVEQNNVIFKGRKFWRIQVTGFLTSNEANAYAASTRKKLGLKETWVMKR